MNCTAVFPRLLTLFSLITFFVLTTGRNLAAQGIAQGTAPPPSAKSIRCKDRPIPQLEDITQKSRITFSHSSSPESRYIIESMSGGVLLLDCFEIGR